MKSLTAFILMSVACATAPFAHATPLSLVKNNQANAIIVLSPAATAQEKTAAGELQNYVQKISGVQLPLVSDKEPVTGLALHIGKTSATQESDLPDARLNPESYKITVRDNAVHFNGRYPTATTFAVYSFLQDSLGVRWFAPGDDWEYVPSHPGNLEVNVENTVKVPDTSPRIWSGHSWTENWQRWNQRNKTVQGERVPWRNFQNNMYRIFPPSKYGKTHPEYYPLVGGKRYIPASDSESLWWPSVGNKDVQRITVEYIRNYFDQNPDQDTFSLGMDDIVYMCGDENSRAMDSSPNDYEELRFSSRFYKFINIIAREVKKTHPDKYIGTLIYSIARELPPDVPKLEDNVFGYLTETSALWAYPDTKQADQQLTREWSKRVSHLLRYDYFGFGTFTPRVYPRLMDEQLKFDKSLGFEGSYIEMYTFLPHTAPMTWALAQLQWDTKKDVGALLDEFYQKMYGKAAPTMRSYYELLEQEWLHAPPARRGWEHKNILIQAVAISPQAVDQGMALLGKAAAEVSTPVEKRRIEVVRGGLQYAGYAIQGYALAQQLSAATIANERDANGIRQQIIAFDKLIHDRDLFWEQARTRPDLLGENLRGLHGLKFSEGDTYLQTNTPVLDALSYAGAVKLVDWYADKPSGAQQISELSSLLHNDEMKSTLNGWQWVKSHQPNSLLVNGDFSYNDAPTATQTAVDWQTSGAPNGWAYWARYKTPAFIPVNAQAKRKGIRIDAPSTANSNIAILLQNIPVNPERRYLAKVWMRSVDGKPCNLRLNFRDKNGGLLSGGKTNIQVESHSREWQQVVVVASVPEEATAVAFMLGTDNGIAEFSAPTLHEIPL